MGDTRTDSGQFYPGGKVIPRQPVRPGGGSDADAVHYYAETKTDEQKAQVRTNIDALGKNDSVTQSHVTGLSDALDAKRDKTDLTKYENVYGEWVTDPEDPNITIAWDAGADTPDVFGWVIKSGGSTLSDAIGDRDSTYLDFDGHWGGGYRITASRTRTIQPTSDTFALVSQLPADDQLLTAEQRAEIADVPNKRPLTDNTCHKTESPRWTWTSDDPNCPVGWIVAANAPNANQPYENRVSGGHVNGWFCKEIDGAGVDGLASGSEFSTTLSFSWMKYVGETLVAFTATATRESPNAVCTKDELYTTPTFINALINGVKTILGSVASGYSTFAEWIAAKLDTAKSVPAYSESATYEVGEIVLHDGAAYKCVTAITTAELWNAAHWTEATDAEIAARLKGFKSDGSVTDQFAVDLMGKQVAKDAMHYALNTGATIQDRAINIVTMTDTRQTITLPSRIVGKTRDLILRVEVGDLSTIGGIALALGSTEFASWEGDALDFEANKNYLVTVTETKNTAATDAQDAPTFFVRVVEMAAQPTAA